jgi:hypothetical protein
MTMGGTTRANTVIAARRGNTKRQSSKKILPVVPREKRICLLGGSSYANPTHWCGMKGLMRAARGLIPAIVAMVLFPP